MFELSIKAMRPIVWFVGKVSWRNEAVISSQAIDLRKLDAVHMHKALHIAYRNFSSHNQRWIARGFNQEFLRNEFLAEVYKNRASALPTGMELARMWDRNFGVLATGAERTRLFAELIPAAGSFVESFKKELELLTEEV